jgi:hypothetical protein
MTQLDHALTLSQRGLYVFPVAVGDKNPATAHGYKDATLDEKLIRLWWKERPTANVAVAAGLSGLLVLDIDPRNNGDASLEELTTQFGALPTTLTVKTQGGGQHYYYKCTPVRSRTALRPGVDIKSHGGYVVGPGSKTDKGEYTYIDDGEIVDAPQWLLDLCEAPRTGQEAPQGDVLDGLLGLAFEHAGLLGKDHGPGMRLALCPFRNEHSSGTDFDTSTVLIAPDTSKGHVRGWVHCFHRCESRPQADFWQALPVESRRHAELAHLDRIVSDAGSPSHVQDWRDALRIDPNSGTPLKTDDNAITILLHEPNWKGCLAYNAMTSGKEWRRVPPLSNPALKLPELGPFKETHVAIINAYLCRVHGWKEIPKSRVFDIVETVAEQNTFHPVRDYLSSLRWDGKPRVTSWLQDYCKATNDPEYLKRAGSWWLVSAVARAFVPGCDAQLVLILEGNQGTRKSTTFRILGGQWFRDTPITINDPVRAGSSLRGVWIYELSELASLGKADQESIKAFVSSPHDWFRGAYKREEQLVLRSGVFGGTLNPDKFSGNAYLKDPTGARRWLPVYVGSLIDTDALQRDREQLWAEAVIMYVNGHKWKPTTTEDFRLCQIVQDERSQVQEEDPTFDRFLRWARNKEKVNLADFSEECGLKLDHWHLTRLGTRLRSEQWTCKTNMVGGTRRRYWHNPNYTVTHEIDPAQMDWTKEPS